MIAIFALLAAAAVPVPAGTIFDDGAAHQVILTAHAEGAQIYQCQPGPGGVLLWTFREPIASLMVDGHTIGHHYAGPHWALEDGSLVAGKLIETTPGATREDIPLLKLAVSENKGLGALSAAKLVFRAKTHGGTLGGVCSAAGLLRAVGYSAEYIFTK